MTLAQYWRVLVKHWALALVPFVLLVGAALAWSFQATPVYTAKASAWFTLPVGQSANDLLQGATYTQAQLGSYAQLATKPIVLEPVITELGLDTTPRRLATSVSAQVVPESVVVQISATDPDPGEAAKIANAVTREIGSVAQELAPTLGDGKAAVSATVVSAATPPSSPSAPNTKRNVLAGALAGLFLGLLLPILREMLDSKVRDPEDLPPGVPVLATLPRVSVAPWRTDDGGRRRSHHADFVITESLRKLQASLRFLDVERPVKVIVISSSVAAEGKTSISIQLARVLAEGSGDVLLVDGDLRRPQIAPYLALEGGIGLADVLAGSVALRHATQRALTPRLHVLPAGSAVPNPAELFGSRPMAQLVESLRGRYDYVVIDAPPMLPVADASVLTAHADGLLLVARYGKVTRAQVASSAQQLERVDARIFGALINATPRPSRWHARSSYYYSRNGTDGTPVGV